MSWNKSGNYNNMHGETMKKKHFLILQGIPHHNTWELRQLK